MTSQRRTFLRPNAKMDEMSCILGLVIYHFHLQLFTFHWEFHILIAEMIDFVHINVRLSKENKNKNKNNNKNLKKLSKQTIETNTRVQE